MESRLKKPTLQNVDEQVFDEEHFKSTWIDINVDDLEEDIFSRPTALYKIIIPKEAYRSHVEVPDVSNCNESKEGRKTSKR